MEALERRRLLSFTPLGGEVAVPGTATAADFDLAVAGNGSYIVVSHLSSGNNDSIVAVRYSSAGEQIGAPSTLDTFSGPGNAVSVSMDADGDAVVAYEAAADTISVVRIDKSGGVSGPTVVASLPAPASALTTPSVSMDSGGGFFVAWIQWDDDGGVSIQARAFDAAGAPRAAQFAAVSLTAVESMSGSELEIDSRPDGSGAVVIYTEIDGIGRAHPQFGLMTTSAAIGGTHGIESAFGDSGGGRAVAVYPDGSFVLGYEQFDTVAAGADVLLGWADFVRRFDATGEPVGPEIELGESLPGSDPVKKFIDSVALEVMPDGGFAAAFVQVVDGVHTLYARRYDAAGVSDESGPVPLGLNVTATIEGSPQLHVPSIGVAADGRTVVLSRATSSGPIQFQRLTTDPAEATLVENGILFVRGTAANDSLAIAIDGSDIVVTGGSQTRTFNAADVNVIIADGFGGDDTITNGTSLKATLRGGNGSDTIFGGSGEDRIHGGVGNDSLWGRDSADKIFGEDGVDSCYGNGGNDRIEGGAQGDHIRGNGGRDRMFGNGGHDRLYGGASGDFIYGQAGNDQILGEGGNDRLYGDDGFGDTLRGGAGDDVFITLDSVADHLFGDGGHDTFNGDDSDVLTSIET